MIGGSASLNQRPAKALERRLAAILPSRVDGEEKRQAVALAGLVVVLAERRRGVDEAGAVGRR